MQPPSTCEAFLELVRKSGLVDLERLDDCLRHLGDHGKMDDRPKKLARHLMREGLLTYLQSEQLLQGKYRGFTLGKYLVLEWLGSRKAIIGLLCLDVSRRRPVVIKMLRVVKPGEPSSLVQLSHAVKALAALKHPNIVWTRKIKRQGDLFFLVQEYVDGRTLQTMVRKHGPMAVSRAAHYIRQVAAGLRYVHEAGLVHRAVHPGNLVLDRCGTVKVLDLGLGRFFNDHGDLLAQPDVDQAMRVPVAYLAPEQARHRDTGDVRADVYGLGATFYFLLSGRTLPGQPMKEPQPLHDLSPDVPDEIAAIIARMTAEDPAQRYASTAAVIEALAPFTQVPIPPPPAEEMPRRSPAALRACGADSGPLANEPALPKASVAKDAANKKAPPAAEKRRGTAKQSRTSGGPPPANPPAAAAVAAPAMPARPAAKSRSHPSPAPREGPNRLVVFAGIGLGLLVVCGIGIGIVSASRGGGKKTEPPLEVSGEQLLREFKANDVEANKKYTGKMVEVHGVVYRVSSNEVELEVGESGLGRIYCRIDDANKEEVAQIKKGERLTVEGLCYGVKTLKPGVKLIDCRFGK